MKSFILQGGVGNIGRKLACAALFVATASHANGKACDESDAGIKEIKIHINKLTAEEAELRERIPDLDAVKTPANAGILQRLNDISDEISAENQKLQSALEEKASAGCKQ